MANKEEGGACSGFTLIKVLQRAVPRVRKKQRLYFLQKLVDQHNVNLDPLKLTLVHFITKCPLAAIEQLQTKYNFCLVVVKSVWHQRSKVTRLLFDGRHAILNNETLAPIHCFVLNKKNNLHCYTSNVNNLPLLYARHEFTKWQTPLHSLLIMDSAAVPQANDPQNKQELIAFLQTYCPPSTKVCINFKFSSQAHHIKQWYETPIIQDVPVTAVVRIKASTSPNYALVYSADVSSALEKAKQRGHKMDKDYEKYCAMWQNVREKQKEAANPVQDSRTSSISITKTSLNLAFDLGVIQSQEALLHLSNQLARTQSSLYVFLDDHYHLRYITYYDMEQHFSTQVPCFVNDCLDFDKTLSVREQKDENKYRHQASEIMLSFWRRVWQRRQRWIERRRYVLKPVVDLLEHLLGQNKGVAATNSNPSKLLRSPYSRCLMDLKQLIHQQRIYMYSSHDSHMHCIKFYFADFAYTTIKKCHGVSVKAQSDSTLTMLSIPGMTLINLHTYFDCKQDQDFFSAVCPTTATQNVSQIVDGPKPSDVFIKHSQKNLLRHPCPQVIIDGSDSNQSSVTLNTFCKQKGLQWSKHILQYWVYFGSFLLKQFGHEIHGQNHYPSASYLGFQCVWTAYAKTAGPFAHSLEKSKAFYEDLIREVSKGGFMFSIEDVLDQGKPLWPSLLAAEQECGNFVAQSIAEMDLISAYGYSASLAYMPSGFCTGFKREENVDKNQQYCNRLDSKARHRSFEFRAVYKSLLELTNQGVAIRTVYSNFSPNGIFCLGPYPIDLAVTTQTGQLFLFQMDGAWCHGCPSCPPLSRYLNKQTHDEVREMTNKRNHITQCWIDQINAAAAAQLMPTWTNTPMIIYTIIQDCHTSGYSPGALEVSFQNEPVLSKLIKGYTITDQCGFAPTLDGLKKSMHSFANNNSYTFIAFASVNILNSNASCNEGPLIVYEPREDKYTRQCLAFSGCVVLTRDYYNWLIKTFGSRFQIISIEWILFYSVEPTLNLIYSRLTRLRSTTDSPVLVSFLKRMINLSCGFYGVRSLEQDKTHYRLVNSLPQNYAFYRHYPDMSYTMDLGQSSYFVLATKTWPKMFKTRKASQSALPMFLTVVEYGKLRLVEILHFIQAHVKPMHFRLLYSNIDNIIFGLANANTLEDAIQPSQWLHFCQNKDEYFAPVPTTNITTLSTDVAIKPPGMAEFKWIRNGHCQWKFVSMRTQHYCVVVSQTDTVDGHLHKTSGWTGLSSLEAYQAASNILQGQKTVITQTRRINKKSNMESQTLEFIF